MRFFNTKRNLLKIGILLALVLILAVAYRLHTTSATPMASKKTVTAVKAKPSPVPTSQIKTVQPAPTTPTPTPKAKINYSYCVKAKGVDASNLPELSTKLASVYGDPRGWSLGGEVSFTKVDTGCSMIVWLSAANLVPSFSEEACSAEWSCTVKPNVIINFDRWEKGSDSWNATGASLDGYRTMVINHETGHWLGFNHRFCAGAGQLAPVMQQQSISLQGCKANSWPLPYELTALKTSLGLQ
jgi:hypothetical protein